MIAFHEMNVILKIVSTYLKVPVVIGEQDKLRPKYDYVSMYLIGQNPIGRNERNTQDCGSIRYGQIYDAEFCFDCIGINAYNYAIMLANMWPLECVQEQLKENKISWHKNYSPKNTSYISGENYVSRISLEVLFYIETITYEQQDLIEKVKYGVNK